MNVEHVQPVETVAPGRGARWHTWLAVALPLVVLVTVATGGVLGGAADPADGGSAAGPIGAVRPTPAGSDPAVATPSEAPDPLSLELPDGFPTDAIGLPVRSVAATADLIRQDRLRESVVAVAGWLTIRPASTDCPNEYDRGTGPTALCPRDTILVGTPEPILEMTGRRDITRLRAPGPHLHPVALPGVSLRHVAGRQYSGLATALRPVPVVLIARVADPRLPECRPSGRHCGEALALERLIWADGEWQDRRALLTTPPFEGADPSPRARRERIDRAVRGAGTILSEILVPRDALPGVDATAGTAIDTTADGAVWYVRFLVRVAGPGGTYPRDVGWAVIDDASGEVVAADPARPPAAGCAPHSLTVVKVDHVEPVRSLAPGRGSGRRTWLAVAVPVVILAVVAAGGMLGRTSEDPGPGVVAAGEPTATPPPLHRERAAADRLVTPADPYAAAGFPADALDLPVQTVAATIERLRGGVARGSAVAVAGWLTIRPSDGGCPIDGPSPASIALCPREAILHDSPAPFLAFRGGEMVRLRSPGVHLHAVALPGRPVALLAERQYRGLGPTLLPVPVVIVGQVGDPRLPPCGPAGRDCDEQLSIEQIVWVEGAGQEHQVIRLGEASADPAPPVDPASTGAEAILSETVVPRTALRSLDPIADAAVDPAAAASVRYVRALAPGARVTWAVVDDASGEVLATDPALLSGSAGSFPPAVLGIDVLDVAAGRALEAGLDDGRLVAVGGLLSIGPDPECGATWRLQCRRTGLLRAPDGSAAAALFVETAPGVPLPGLRRTTPRLTSWTEAVPAVVVGRFVDGGGRRCGLRRSNCEPVFTVLHLAWLDGTELPTTISTELGVRATKQTRDVVGVAQAGAGDDSAVLGLTLLSPRTLAAIDPVAAAVLGSEGDGRVWYVRLASSGPAGLEATWALVDDATGRLLASS